MTKIGPPVKNPLIEIVPRHDPVPARPEPARKPVPLPDPARTPAPDPAREPAAP